MCVCVCVCVCVTTLWLKKMCLVIAIISSHLYMYMYLQNPPCKELQRKSLLFSTHLLAQLSLQLPPHAVQAFSVSHQRHRDTRSEGSVIFATFPETNTSITRTFGRVQGIKEGGMEGARTLQGEGGGGGREGSTYLMQQGHCWGRLSPW